MRIDTRCLVQNSGSSVYVCSLVVGHAGQHEAWNGHKVEPLGERLFAWPQETKSGPSNVTTFAELRDLVIELEARETETRLRHAERLENLEQTSATGAATDDMFAGLGSRLDAFEDRLQRLRDDTRDTAAMAGEALERTKGLQVPEILRRLSQTERRINSMDGGRAALEQKPATDERLLNAVTELTTVMREAVAAQREGAVLVQRGLDALTPPELCGEADHIGHVTCELEKGHTSRHVNGISSWPKEADPGPRTCHFALHLDGNQLPRVLAQGHAGAHLDADRNHWHVGPVKS